MNLPPFPKKRPKGQIKKPKINKELIEGKIEFDHKNNVFRIIKNNINYGEYETMTEAFCIKKKLMENKWDPNCLVSINKIQKDIIINKTIEISSQYKVKINYCPYCKKKLNKHEKICPICGNEIG